MHTPLVLILGVCIHTPDYAIYIRGGFLLIKI